MKLGKSRNRVREFDARPWPRIGAFQARNSAIPPKVVADLPFLAHRRPGIYDALDCVAVSDFDPGRWSRTQRSEQQIVAGRLA